MTAQTEVIPAEIDSFANFSRTVLFSICNLMEK